MSYRCVPRPLGLVACFATLICLAAKPVPATAQTSAGHQLPLGLWEAVRPLAQVDRVEAAAVDHATLQAEDAKRAAEGLPPRYAVPAKVAHVPERAGTWELAPSGERSWRLVVHSPGALSLNFGFTRYRMPAGGRLFVYTPDGAGLLGPYTDADNETHGELWTPPVPGDTAVIEVNLPVTAAPFLELALGSINRGYTTAFLGRYSGNIESGACNVDVVCPEGDDWRDEIRAVAVISTGGSTFCSGFLVNNVREDQAPYFMTADHCGITAANAASLVVFWNYENSTCRAPGSPASGSPGDGTLNDFQSGAFFRASRSASDFTLVELDDPPAFGSNVHWTGWDNTSADPTSAAGIHHPNTDEKRISFENNPLTTTSWGGDTPLPGGDHVRVADWDLGTTEPGSSGSGLWNQDRRIVGQLHGGGAACGNNLPDWYGRFSVSWAAGGTPDTQLRDWLDPDNTGATVLDGRDQCTPPTADFTIAPNPTQVGELITFTSTVGGGVPPYTYAWDLDADGQTDCTDPVCTRTYSAFFNDAIALRVTDAQPCPRTVTRTLSVSGALVIWDATGAPAQLCGVGDTLIEPGEQWRVPVTVRNVGTLAAQNVTATAAAAGAPANVTVLTPTLNYPDLPPDATAVANLDFGIGAAFTPCGASVPFDLTGTAWTGGSGPGAPDIFAAATGGGSGPQDLFFDDFESGAAWANWTVTTGPGLHTAGAWTRIADHPYDARPPGSTGYFAIADSDAPGPGTFTSTILTSPAIDVSGFPSGPITLECDMYFSAYSGGGNESGLIEAFNGSTWTTLATYTADASGPATFDVTAQAAGNANFRVRFSYQNANWDWWFAVDNVRVSVPVTPVCDNPGDCGAAVPAISWITPPPPTAVGGDPIPLTWELADSAGPITENQAHFGITSVLGSSPVQPGANGLHSSTLQAPNVGPFDAPRAYAYIIRALDNGTQMLSPVAVTVVEVGPAPPTVAWVTPPPASVPSGGQFTATWELTNYVDSAAANACGCGITSILLATPGQPGGNGAYTATLNIPVVGGPGTILCTAYAENSIEFAFAPIVPVQITVP